MAKPIRNAEVEIGPALVGVTVKNHRYSVYIVASKSRSIYIGMTNNLERRIYEHKNDSGRLVSAKNTAATVSSITSRSTTY